MSTSELDIDMGLGTSTEGGQQVAPRRAGPLPVMATERGHYDEIVRLAPQDVEIEVDVFGSDKQVS